MIHILTISFPTNQNLSVLITNIHIMASFAVLLQNWCQYLLYILLFHSILGFKWGKNSTYLPANVISVFVCGTQIPPATTIPRALSAWS